MIRWALALLLAALLAPAVARADAVDEVQARLARVDTLLVEARDADVTQQAALAGQARDELRSIRTMPGTGRLLDVEAADDLEAALDPEDLDIPAAIQALAWLRLSAYHVPPADPGRVDAARQALSDVLARPEFQWQRQSYGFLDPILGPLLGVLAGIVEFGMQQLDSLFQFILDVLAGRVSPETIAALIVSFLLVAFSIGFVVRRIAGAVAPETRQRVADESAPGVQASQTWAFALARAEQGDFRSAVRLLYLATLQELDEQGILRFERALTNREHLRHAPSTLLPLLGPLVDRYDVLWYGRTQLGEEDYRDFRALAQRLRGAA